jgi:hypothetical protein
MSPVRAGAALALGAVLCLTFLGCEDAQRDPPPAADPTGGAAPAPTAGGPGGVAGSGGAASGGTGGVAGTGGRGGGAGSSGGAPGAGSPTAMICPPNPGGTPCGAAVGTGPICTQATDAAGAVSGCVCLQMMWVCGTFPGPGGSADAGARVQP